MSSEDRKKILLDVADALEKNEPLIRQANDDDIEAAEEAGYEESLISRLRLKQSKVTSLLM